MGQFENPGYMDPDVTAAENLIIASYHLQKAGELALAETCALKAADTFGPVPVDKKRHRKILGNAYYDPSGILSCPDGSGYAKVPAPPWDDSDDGSEATAQHAKYAKSRMRQEFNYCADRYGLGWFASGQLRAAIEDRTFKTRGRTLSAALENLQKTADAWKAANGDPTATKTCEAAAWSIMRDNPVTGPMSALSGSNRTYDNKYGFTFYWFRHDVLDGARSRTEACMANHDVLRNIVLDAKGRRQSVSWPWSPRVDRSGHMHRIALQAWQAIYDSLPGDQKPDKPHYNVPTALEQAFDTGMRVWTLCQAYHAFAAVQDKESIGIFRAAGILSKNPDFMPSDDLWASIAALSVRMPERQWYAHEPMKYEAVCMALESGKDILADWLFSPEVQASAAFQQPEIHLVNIEQEEAETDG